MPLLPPPLPPLIPSESPPLLGLDIETDTAVDGLDPAVGRVLAVAIARPGGVTVFDDGDEGRLLARVDEFLAATDPGVLVTWNGGGFDLPYLATRSPANASMSTEMALLCSDRYGASIWLVSPVNTTLVPSPTRVRIVLSVVGSRFWASSTTM